MKIYPSVEEIKEKYQSFKTVPVSTEIEADVSALTVLKKLKNVSSHCYMLESNVTLFWAMTQRQRLAAQIIM